MRCYAAKFRRLITPVIGVLGVLIFVLQIQPLMGGSQPKSQKINLDFFRLISPTHYPAHSSCSKGSRSLKFVMRIDPLMRD